MNVPEEVEGDIGKTNDKLIKFAIQEALEVKGKATMNRGSKLTKETKALSRARMDQACQD